MSRLEPAPIVDDLAETAEDLLALYQPALRRQRGVYATPRPLVVFVARAVHELLQSRFERPGGLAEADVRLLDPCAGPMNFLIEAWREALVEGCRRGIEPCVLLRDHLLPHSQGIELLGVPYRLGCLAVRGFLERYGYRLEKGERLPLALGDALADRAGDAAPRAGVLPVLVGNPPYSGKSANRGRWISDLLHGYELADGRRNEGYYRIDGHPLGERNPKWLQDDAVKFLRFAEWTVDRVGQGLVGFVLNHNFIDAPTFRGLRASLLATFDEVYALDLHGNQRKRERQPDDRADGNVFHGVAQGIAVLFLVKRPGLAKRMLRADLYGDRSSKLHALLQATPATISWTEIQPHSPSYLFVASGSWRERQYRCEISLREIFAVSTTGIITGRDAMLTDLDRGPLEERLAGLRPESRGDAEDVEGLSAANLRSLRADARWQRRIAPLVVRPFDVRQVIYADYLLARPRRAIMDQMLGGDNLGLVVARQCKEDPGALVTAWLVGHKAVSAYDVNMLFPLFARCPRPRGSADPPYLSNVRPELRRRLADLYGRSVDPAEIFAYVYGVLYSPPYRARYRSFLQRDFPRIPFPRSARSFALLGGLGHELIDLHLVRDERLLRPAVRVCGDSRRPLARRRSALADYREPEARLYLDEHGFGFDGLTPEVWRYRIGGHQVLLWWLLARRGRILRHGELSQFRWAAEALGLTLAVQAKLVEAYRCVEDERASLRG